MPIHSLRRLTLILSLELRPLLPDRTKQKWQQSGTVNPGKGKAQACPELCNDTAQRPEINLLIIGQTQHDLCSRPVVPLSMLS